MRMAALNVLIIHVVISTSYPTTRVYTTSESEPVDGCVQAGTFIEYANELYNTVDDTYEDFVSKSLHYLNIVCFQFF